MKKTLIVLWGLLFIANPIFAAEGMINISSEFSVEETANRLENILKTKGMIIFKQVKHSESAAAIGIELRKTELIIFGNPKVGSPLMQCQQTVAIDLPQKALIWQDEKDKVWISYNDPMYLMKRHDIKNCEETISKIDKALMNIIKAAANQ